jgi:hypothetical protein
MLRRIERIITRQRSSETTAQKSFVPKAIAMLDFVNLNVLLNRFEYDDKLSQYA